MTLTSIPRKKLGDLVIAHAETLTGVKVYRGQVDSALPIIQTNGANDPSGRVAPYLVFYLGAGAPSLEEDVADANVDLLWSFQVNCAAGFEQDCARLIDRVDALFYRWSPPRGSIPGLVFGRMKPPPGYDPGPVRLNDAVNPPRFWLPRQYQLPVTT